jgi:hypothetical protein
VALLFTNGRGQAKLLPVVRRFDTKKISSGHRRRGRRGGTILDRRQARFAF